MLAAELTKFVAPECTVRLAVPVFPDVMEFVVPTSVAVPTVRPPAVMVVPPVATVRPFWCNVAAPSPVSVKTSTLFAVVWINLNAAFMARDVFRCSTLPAKEALSACSVSTSFTPTAVTTFAVDEHEIPV